MAAGAVFAMVTSGLAVADTLTADGDVVSTSNNVLVSDCAGGLTRAVVVSTGAVALTAGNGGGNSFVNSTTVSIASSAANDLIVPSGHGTLTTPSNWSSSSQTLSRSIGVTVGAGLAPGTYPVTVTASGLRSPGKNKDNVPLTLTSIYNVVVSCPADTTPPALSLSANLTQEATAATTPVTFAATATDLVSGSVRVDCAPASGTSFALGATTVTCAATDAAGNTSTDSFTVTVVDTTAPTLLLPSPIYAEASGPEGVAVTYSARASDLVSGDVVPVCSPASGATFPLGTTSVSCTATDARAHTATGTFPVTVGDSTDPVVTVPADITAEATSAAGAVVTFSASAADEVTTPLSPVCTPASGSTFALSETPVSCSATDGAGNTGVAGFTVTVLDRTGPVLSGIPATQTLEATGPDGASLEGFAPSALDAVDVLRAVTCSTDVDTIAVDYVYALDVTTVVTCSSADTSGNTTTATYSVAVEDTTGPALSLPTPITVEATGPAGAAVAFSATALDLVDGELPASCYVAVEDHAPAASGDIFRVGTTAVSCTATDAHGNRSGVESFSVTVQDTTAPIIEVHEAVVAEATTAAGSVVNYGTPATSDAVDGAGVASCVPASGAQFPLGGTPVRCDAVDEAGNRATQTSFTVTVADTTAPAIAPVEDIVMEATSAAGADVYYVAPNTTDAVDGDAVASCDPASATTFVLGETVVTCSVVDGAGNASASTFRVTVRDTTAPEILDHVDETAEATSAAGATVTYSAPGTTDAVDGNGTASCLPASGSTFALGATLVTCNATDAARNPADPTTFSVNVLDRTSPIISAHGGEEAEATGPAGAAVSYLSPTTSDAVDGPGTAGCLPASGSTFPLGDSTVTCTALDQAGNAAASSRFTISVVDTTSPVVADLDDLTLEATGASGSVATFTAPSATDAVDGTTTALCAPASGSTFALGTTTVTCSTNDAHGNRGSSDFTVTVKDTTGPAVAPHDPVAAQATSTAGAVVSFTSPAWKDAVSGAGTAACLPASGSQFALGTSTVTCSAVDEAGNGSMTNFAVVVSFGWHGFFQPIDTAGGNGKDSSVTQGTIYNKVKAGSSIPVKFDLGGNMGLGIFASGYPRAAAVTCASAATYDQLEETATSTTSGLKYDATTNAPVGQYNYTWKSTSSYANTCQRLQVKLVDGMSYYAFFNFTK